MNIELSAPESEVFGVKHGIYCVRIRKSNSTRWFCGVAHYGPRPAVHAADSFEVHCFDFDEDWYGEKVEIEIGEYIREILNFKTIDELRAQIVKDIEQGRSKARKVE